MGDSKDSNELLITYNPSTNKVKRIMQNITFCVKSCVLGKQKSDAFPNNSLLMINFVRRNIVRKSII